MGARIQTVLRASGAAVVFGLLTALFQQPFGTNPDKKRK